MLTAAFNEIQSRKHREGFMSEYQGRATIHLPVTYPNLQSPV